jgi:hypothetical protein
MTVCDHSSLDQWRSTCVRTTEQFGLRSRGEARLVVVPDLDRVFWAGDRRVVVGPAVLAPRAIATWSE